MLNPTEVKIIREKVYDDQHLQRVCKDIDEKLTTTVWAYEDRIEIAITGEYTKEFRDNIAKLYKDNGWSEVIHKTSSENNERPGITGFTFYY